jgi:hypothetical protein
MVPVIKTINVDPYGYENSEVDKKYRKYSTPKILTFSGTVSVMGVRMNPGNITLTLQ